MKEAKLKINAERIVQSCRIASRIYDMSYMSSDRVKYHTLLKAILEKNLEIESEHLSKKEKQEVLSMIENNICQYLLFTRFGCSSVEKLHEVLESKNDKMIEAHAICLANEIIQPNLQIYSPGHGIHRQTGEGEKVELIKFGGGDLRTRTCTLQIDDTKFSGLENAARFASESLDRELFFNFSISMQMMGIEILKNHMPVETPYTLDQLYSDRHENTDVLLIDHGLRLIRDKYAAIEHLVDLVKRIEKMPNCDTKNLQREITSVLKKEELKLVISITENLGAIRYEKRVQDSMLKAIEYMVDNTELFKGKDRSSALRINADLSDFNSKYVTSQKGLEETVMKKRKELTKESRKNFDSIGLKNAEYSEQKERFEKLGAINESNFLEYQRLKKEMKRLECEIDSIKNNGEFVMSAVIRENVYSNLISTLLSNSEILPRIISVQKQYIIKKIEELGKAKGMKVEVASGEVKKPEEHQVLEVEAPKERSPLPTKLTRENLFKTFLSCAAVMKIATTLLAPTAIEAMSPADVDNILNCEDQPCYEQPPIKKHREM
ncbi:hypothetical protein NEMIN01_2411 [Nematocida minor]|uniref:uncharacterized protein n=1 Tax=Nematocida minor TaxID=1912983 RepID=UPI00221E5322|nr:uncharacterized protein NEMIN01_2411 [Nematocida minor]KAI5193206.1 hypothetical protein NEMIN01_2411 [Nematocida minor]